MTRLLPHLAFAVGLLALGWVGAGYVPGHLLALGLVLLIGAFYVAGALELFRFRQATAGLAKVLSETTTAPPTLGPWLAQLPASLRHAVRMRVEGERVALPGPALTPYLGGLLVLLGMLGTFLGMVVTLKGTGLALESASGVEGIRASLSAPVQGLGLAFGTSVAGVAASAMLGLMSALARRERQTVAQQLDALAAGTLRGFSQAAQREESLQLLRAQAEAMPALVTQLQSLVTHLEQQGQTLQQGLLAGQQNFHAETQQAYRALAASVDQTLKTSLADSARLASAAIEPAVRETMAGLAQQSHALRDTLSAAVQQQLDSARQANAAIEPAVREAMAGLTAQGHALRDTLSLAVQQQLATVTARLDSSTTALVDGLTQRLEHSTAQWARSWSEAVAQQREGQAALTQHTRDALAATVAGFEQHAAALLRSVAEAHGAADAAAAARDQARDAAFQTGLAAMTATVQAQALADSRAAAEQHQQICRTLEQTAQTITAQTEAHARATIAEIARLVETASQAPRAAAEVIGELRTALSDSLVRDNAVLDERNRLLGTLGGLLDAVNHASTEQRAAIDGLVQTTADVLDRMGSRFAQTVDAESQTLQAVAAQVTGSAAEVASLGEGFGTAVQLFSRSTEQLMAQLQRIEGALGQSMARSDEQLAYYVAQAREIIDLTLGSQKQIVEDLQRLGRAPSAAEVQAA